jgi:mannose-1-phosphate guanylyltransferase/mannose-6-phosphate isomerase
MSDILITPVILSGGAGTRLWPLSHEGAPKQFHALASDRTMLQDTALRTMSVDGVTFTAPVVICASGHRAEVNRQLSEIGAPPSRIVLEPFGRNTAAAAYIAAAVVAELSPGSLALLLPADHVIADRTAFSRAIAAASETARRRIVTFGITPDGPETGYGYIQQGEPLADGVFKVARFAEKPSRPVAAGYLAEGGYSWNAGIFLFAPSVMMSEMEALSPDIAKLSQLALTRGRLNGAALELDGETFAVCPSEPVDVAVMEKTSLAAVIPCDMGWADLGSWSELHKLGPRDAQDNLVRGDAHVLDGERNLVWSNGAPVVIVGLNDIAVVSTSEGVIVLPLARAQDVKLAVAAVKASRKDAPT